ncbi:MAG: arginase family protein [Candidatus Bathyarchaeia archaeon]
MLEEKKSVKVFGIAFDPDEYLGAIERQLYIALLKSGIDSLKSISDPYDLLIPYIEEAIGSNRVIRLGKIPVESWLSPKPDLEDEELINIENYSTFIDANGCKEYVNYVEEFVQRIMDESSIPLMIGIDHSMSGGMIIALSKRYGAENLSVIVLDSHLDAIPTSIRYKLFTSLKKKKHPLLFLPDEFYISTDSYDPLVFERPDSYNKGSFLYYLIKEQILLPKNLWVVGVQDRPTEDLLREEDPNLKSYLEAYLNLENEGVNIITNNEIVKAKNFVNKLDAISTQFLYISFDVDVGCGSSITLARCLPNEKGLYEHDLYNLARMIRENMNKKKVDLVGLDVMEIDIHYLRPNDNTPIIIANTIKCLLGANDA